MKIEVAGCADCPFNPENDYCTASWYVAGLEINQLYNYDGGQRPSNCPLPVTVEVKK